MKTAAPSGLLVVVLLMSSCAALHASAQHRLGVEVWVHGSDIETEQHIVTLSLRDALESALDHSATYCLAFANAGKVRVTIPDDVILISEDGVRYANFEADIVDVKEASSRKLFGRCRVDEIQKCAAEVLPALAPP